MTDDELKSAIAFNTAHDLPDEISKREFTRLVYAAQRQRGLSVDGKYGTKSFGVFGTTSRVIPWPTPLIVDYADGVYPVVDNGGHPFRITSGYMWPERTASSGPHPGGDFCQRIAGRFPESDGIFGAKNGTECCASWPGTVIDAERVGAYWSVSLWHKVRMTGGNVIDLIAYFLHVTSHLQTVDEFGQVLKAGEIFCEMRTVPNRLNHLHGSHHDCNPLEWHGADGSAGWAQNKATSIPIGGKDYGATYTRPGTDAWRLHEGALADWRRIAA